MNEKPMERLNYFNGQRLQAADFKLEQDYHMRVRRWLNRSLYTPGIASGLEVYPIPKAARVKVLPGLAIDHLGREIILLEERNVDVVDKSGGGNGVCEGPYLTIRYQEEVIAQQDAYCAVGGIPANHIAWGGPARILADPVLELNAELPHPSSGKIALACLTLAPGCASVERVDTGVRRYVGEASAARVRQYALEGLREVAAVPDGSGGSVRVTAKVLFHVRGRQPNSVTLYLKARQFSALRYTEIGSHVHGLTVNGGTGNPSPDLDAAKTSHFHSNNTLKADNSDGAKHSHTFTARRGYIGKHEGTPAAAAFFLIERDWGVKLGLAENTGNVGDIFDWLGNKISDALGASPTWAPETNADTNEDLLGPSGGTIGGGGHEHTISGDTASKGFDLTHTHSISGTGTSDPFGATDSVNSAIVARSGNALRYVYDLQIAIDGTDKTVAIREQIANGLADPEARQWALLGDGGETHPLAADGKEAVPIKLDYLPGVLLDEGEHSIEFSVNLKNGEANGGLVQFNLYVE